MYYLLPDFNSFIRDTPPEKRIHKVPIDIFSKNHVRKDKEVKSYEKGTKILTILNIFLGFYTTGRKKRQVV